MHDVAGSLTAPEVTGQLTDLAEVCLRAAIAAVLPRLTARWGGARTAPAVLGLGSLGAREMRYGSDLDLVFLYGNDGESTTGITHQEGFSRGSAPGVGTCQTR